MPVVNFILSAISAGLLMIYSQFHQLPVVTRGSVEGASFTAIHTSVPLATPTPSAASKPKLKSTPKPTVAPDSLGDYIMNQINDYRKNHGLSLVKENNSVCNFAVTRAKEISTAFNHGGFESRTKNKTIPYPGYTLITENLARTTNYKDVETLWANSAGHAANMRADTPFVCVAKYGDYYAYEGWRP